MEISSLKDVEVPSKIALLKELGYDSDGKYVYKDGNKFLDKYTEEEIKVENIAILPGSTIIIDDNPLSIASYLEEHPDVI